MINGWKITKLPDGFVYKFEAERGGYAEKFYSRAGAENFASRNPA